MQKIVQKINLMTVAMLVAVLLASLWSVSVGAAGTTWPIQRISPDTWDDDMGYGFISDMEVFDGDLWVAGQNGSTAALWRYDANGNKTWASALPTGFTEGSGTPNRLAIINGKLYVTISNSGSYDAQLWSYDGTTWEEDAAFADLELEWVYSVAPLGDEPCAYGWKDNTIVSYCRDEGTWEDTDIASVDADVTGNTSMNMVTANSNKLYANARISANDDYYENIWQHNGTSWDILETPFTDESSTDSSAAGGILDMEVGPDDSLIVSVTSGYGAGFDIQVYQYSDTTWTQLGTDVNFGQGDGADYGDARLTTHNGTVLASATKDVGGAELFQWDGTEWIQRNEPYFGLGEGSEDYPLLGRELAAIGDEVFLSTSFPTEGEYKMQVWSTAASDDESDQDLNGDEIPDSEQPNIGGYENPITGKTVAIDVGEDCELTTDDYVRESQLAVQDPAYDYENGLWDFEADCGTPGYTTTVSLYYYDVTPDSKVLRKHNPSTNAFFTLTDASISTQTINGHSVTIVTYQITDGGERDTDGETNGMITDPAGLAQAVLSAPNTGLGHQANKLK